MVEERDVSSEEIRWLSVERRVGRAVRREDSVL